MPTITPRERVRTALAHRQSDRVPWQIGVTAHMRARLAERLGRPDLAGGEAFTAWAGNHLHSVGPRATGQFHGLEEEVRPGLWRDGWGIIWDTRGMYGEGEWGRPVNAVLSRPSLAGFTFPEPPGSEAYTHYPETIGAHRDLYVLGREGHLFEVAWALRGMEDFLADMILHPEFVDDLLDGITEYYLGVIDRSVRYDIDGFTFGEDWGSQSRGLIMGPRLWRRFLKPRLARLFARVKAAGKYVHIHSDGDVTAIFPDLIEIGLDVYNPFQPEIMDVYALKEEYGDRLAFYGGVGIQSLLPNGTPGEVRAEAERLIRRVGAGGGYILAPSHSVLTDTPVENLVALMEVVQGQ
jgi:uroporphyrinogen decarboxylase